MKTREIFKTIWKILKSKIEVHMSLSFTILISKWKNITFVMHVLANGNTFTKIQY